MGSSCKAPSHLVRNTKLDGAQELFVRDAKADGFLELAVVYKKVNATREDLEKQKTVGEVGFTIIFV